MASKHQTNDEVRKQVDEINPLVTPTIKVENVIHNMTSDSFHTKSNHLQGMIDRLVRNRENISEGEIELRSFYEKDGQEQSQIGVLADFASVSESERM